MKKRIIQNLFFSNFPPETPSDSLATIAFLNIIAYVVFLYCLVFGYEAIISRSYITLGLDIFVGSCYLFIFFYLRTSKKLTFAANFSAFFMGIFFLGLFQTGGVENTGYVWTFCFPIFALFTLGAKTGSIVTLVYTSVIACMLFIPNASVYHSLFSISLKMRLLGSYSAVLLSVFIYEYTRTLSIKKVEEKSRQLEESNTLLTKTQDELQAQYFFKIALFLAVPTPIFYQDDKSRFLGCNKSFEELTGKTDDEITGFTSEELWDNKYSSTYNKKNDELLRYGGTQTYTGNLYNSQEQVLDVVFSKAAIKRPDASIEGLIGVVLDITELTRAKKKAESASIARGRFLAQMSHEIRTPLNGILGMVNILFDTTLNKQQEKYVDVIKQSGYALLAVISDILDFSCIEKGNIKLQKINFNLGTVFDELKTIVSYTTQEKGLPLITEIDEDIPKKMFGDPVRLRQVLLNLITNALKFTEKGRVELTARVKEVIDSSYIIQFDVRDTGIGIAPDKIPSLFNAFYQVDSSLSRKHGGSGLGLAICRELLELQDGKISVSSTLDIGTTFTCLIPFDIGIPEDQHEDESLHKEIALPEQSNVKSPLILLVEDNEINQGVTVLMLQNLNYIVEVANDGVEALEKIRCNMYDCILMDIQMPRMDGFEATHRIRNGSAGKEAQSIPIIALTAHTLQEDLDKCSEYGMNDYLTKPYTLESLKTKIENTLKE